MPIKSFKYRLYPTEAQSKKIDNSFDLCRFLYNCALEERISYYKHFGKGLSYAQQAAFLSEIKELFPEYAVEIHSQVLQDVLKRLDKAFKNFFRRVKNGEIPGFPRFKSIFSFKSFTYPQSGFRIEKNKIFLSKIGHVKFNQHRELCNGKVKTCTIIREASGKYYICLAVEYERENVVEIDPNTTNEIGLDLGIKNYITDSNGNKTENPRISKRYEKRLATAQRKLSKKPKRSEEKIRARKSVARCHEKITNCREDFQHKTSRNLVEKYDRIYLEKLNIDSILQSKDSNKNLNRNVMDCSWSRLVSMIVYKAEETGKQVIFVDPRNTTKECSRCGAIIPKELSQRRHICDKCGLEMDRDHNAAINILNRGKSLISLGRVGTDSPV